VLAKLGSLAGLAVLLLGLPAPAAAQQETFAADTLSSVVNLKLERDGVLSVTERITVPAGTSVHRVVPLRQSSGDDTARVFSVPQAEVEGSGDVEVTDEQLEVRLQPGVSTLRYSVRGAVADAEDGQRVQWQVSSGWNVPVDRVEVESFLSPQLPLHVECLAGPLGSTERCAEYGLTHTLAVHAVANQLDPGERMVLDLKLPPGAVPANAVLTRDFSLARAFSLTPASGAGLVGIALALIGVFGVLWYLRGRDGQALAEAAEPVDVLLPDSRGGVTFASPDGVLPGQIGTVIDERVDPVDVAATIIDLAVRNYLVIEELPGPDWRFVQLNPPDEHLRPFERAVHRGLFGGAEEVRLSQLHRLPLGEIRDQLYRDVVEKDWFARRPDADRNLFWWIGAGVVLSGVALTAVLALTTHLALLGVGVVLGGGAMVVGARAMPARTRRGSALVLQVRGLRRYLHEVTAESIPPANRELVFSRSLPYAVVLEEAPRWLAKFAGLDPAADGTPGLYWYREQGEQPDLRQFRQHFPLLVEQLGRLAGGSLRMRAPAGVG
jgi:hypothetical protein